MLSKTHINNLMQTIKSRGRYIDYCLLSNLFECEQFKMIEALRKYQNNDGGFGKGLEPDVRLPLSNVVSTDEAVLILEEFTEESLVKGYIEDIVAYYENTYIEKKEAWELVPKEVNDYPRASWWNYDNLNNFTYGNPNPQIIGFLYRHKDCLKKIDIDYQVEKVVDYIQNELLEEASKHNILSCLHFYRYMPLDIKEKIYDILLEAVSKELKNEQWETYCLEPYEIKLIAPEFLENHLDLLDKNIEYNTRKIENGLIMPNWKWGQYEDVFEIAKFEWAGHLTYKVIKALLT